MGAVLLTLLVSTFFLRYRFFNASQAQLDQAAAVNNVTYSDSKHSFDIRPINIQSKKVGLIIYPGALIDSRAYAPKFAKLAGTGVSVFIIKPYLRLAILSPSLANTVIRQNTDISKWYVGGHSMGGGAACHFAKDKQSSVDGLILFASYCADRDKDLQPSTLAIVGTSDPLEPLVKVQKHLPSQALIKQIHGANHASFANYGKQPLDGTSEIDDVQMGQELTKLLSEFIR